MSDDKTPTIPINIWDDFHDDDYVPEGKVQSTHAYVENYEMDEALKERALNYFYETLKLMGILEPVTMSFTGDEIRFVNLTHKLLDALMDELEKVTLTFEGHVLDIYSES